MLDGNYSGPVDLRELIKIHSLIELKYLLMTLIYQHQIGTLDEETKTIGSK